MKKRNLLLFPKLHHSIAPRLMTTRHTVPPYLGNRPLLVAGKPELRGHKAVFVLGDQEVSQFSDEVIVNCAP